MGEVLTHDMFKKSQDEAHGGEIDEKKKSVAFKAQDTKLKKKVVVKKKNRMRRWLSLSKGSIE